VVTPLTHERTNRWSTRLLTMVAVGSLLVAATGCDGDGGSSGGQNKQPKPTPSAHSGSPSISCETAFVETHEDDLTVETGIAAKGHGGVRLTTATFTYGDGSRAANEPLKKESFGNSGAKHEHTYKDPGKYALGIVVHGLTKKGKGISKRCYHKKQQVGEPPVKV